MCYFFSDIIKLEDFDFDNILIDEKSKGKYSDPTKTNIIYFYVLFASIGKIT